MGLGKTVQVLAMLDQRRLLGSCGPSLVVVPRSLVFNWQQEAAGHCARNCRLKSCDLRIDWLRPLRGF